jgi:alkyldihydroxyacetonephosphate synthase
VYRSGINLYFSFAAARDNPEDLQQAYLDCWDAVMQAAFEHGGGISHHHGIGRIRSKYLIMDIGESGLEVLRSIKAAIDPNNIMNPGVLLENA